MINTGSFDLLWNLILDNDFHTVPYEFHRLQKKENQNFGKL